ncbi:MAG: hypothetical protein ACQES7_04355 [Pseudomonadota bacterium]
MSALETMPSGQPIKILKWEDLSDAERLAIKAMSEASFEAFLRIWFQLLQGQYFRKNWHHTYECRLAEDVYHGKIKRGIINVAPGSTKTEIWSVHWPAWGIIKCIQGQRSSRWLPLSYSDDLVTENSSRVKEIIDSEEFQSLWPLAQSKDTKGKSDWKYRDEHGNVHRMYGTSTNGQVTGRRAGYMSPGFTGALILDDPMPPKDGDSAKVMEKSNRRINRVVRSRLAHDDVPIIMVQQRISKGDTTDFLMSDKAPDDYELFTLPALVDREYLDGLSDDMREACIADTGFEGKRCSYWPDKEPTEVLLAMEKADNYMFSSQYQQDPDEALVEGVVYKREVELLKEEGRLTPLPVEKSLPVYTFWDLGINDDMVVWLMQPHRKELRMIACYGNSNEGMEHYINWLNDFRDKYGVRYEKHLAPHDIAVRDLMTKRSRIDTAKEMGIKFTLVERTKSKRDSINALKVLMPRIWIDPGEQKDGIVSKGCAKGWEALKTLRRQWDPDNETFKDEVGPKWATNYTDALQQMGLHYKDPTPTQTQPRRAPPSSGGWLGA